MSTRTLCSLKYFIKSTTLWEKWPSNMSSLGPLAICTRGGAGLLHPLYPPRIEGLLGHVAALGHANVALWQALCVALQHARSHSLQELALAKIELVALWQNPFSQDSLALDASLVGQLPGLVLDPAL